MAATAVANNPEDIVAASYVGFDCACPRHSAVLTLQRSPGRSNTSFSSAVSSSMSWLSVRISVFPRAPRHGHDERPFAQLVWTKAMDVAVTCSR